MRKFQLPVFVLKQSYICYYIICMTVPLITQQYVFYYETQSFLTWLVTAFDLTGRDSWFMMRFWIFATEPLIILNLFMKTSRNKIEFISESVTIK